MSEQKETNVSRGLPKKVVSILIIALFVCGAGVGAFFLFGGSSNKATYFKAEVDTYEFLVDTVKERFEQELDWLHYTENNPIDSTVDITAQFNDPGMFGYGMMFDIEEIINNSKISVSSQSDIKNKQLTADLSANIAGFDFSDFRFGLTEEFVLIELPFLHNTLKIESKDTGKFLHMIDPYTFEEDANIDFADFFDTNYSFLSEEDKEHFSKHYGELIYKEITEDAFTSEKESIEVADEKINTEKIELTLANEELKYLTKKVIETMQADDYLRQMLTDQFEKTFISPSEIAELMDEFDESLETALEEIEDAETEIELTSTIWINKNLIVKREFAIQTIDENDIEETLTVKGTQLLENDAQTFDYVFAFEDEYSEESFNVEGNLAEDGGKYSDSLLLTADEVTLIYEADEDVKGDKKEFTRTISFDDGWTTGALVWEGEATYEKDQMSGNHQIYVDAEGISQDLFTLHLDVTGKKIKQVEMLDEKDSLNIGSMSEAELEQYIEGDAQEQFMEWSYDIFGSLGELFY